MLIRLALAVGFLGMGDNLLPAAPGDTLIHGSALAPSQKKPLDFVVASDDGLQIWFGDGLGHFQASDQGFLKLPSTTSVAVGDLNGDGALDLFVTRYEQHPNQVWFNDGTGHFRNSGQALGRTDNWRAVLGDLDGDGDLDAFLANTQHQPNRVLFNDGKGHFTDSGQALGTDNTLDVVLMDCDGDGDLDVIEANRASPNRLWLNDGKGRFTDSHQNLGNWKSRRIAVGALR